MVSLPRTEGHWREEWIGPAGNVIPFPPGLTPEQAALFRVNPLTAWLLLHEFVDLKPEDWIVQNAATSAVGRAVIVLARHLGFRTLNLVRREEDIGRLKAEGADTVIVADKTETVLNEIGVKAKLGLNAVGGESAALVSRCLERGATHVTYGAMARQPLRISNKALIFDDLRFRGFWLTEWRKHAAPEKIAVMETRLAALFRDGILQTGIETDYPLDRFAEAIAHAAQGGRMGKIVFRMG